jgi:hypothetical protein
MKGWALGQVRDNGRTLVLSSTVNITRSAMLHGADRGRCPDKVHHGLCVEASIVIPSGGKRGETNPSDTGMNW